MNTLRQTMMIVCLAVLVAISGCETVNNTQKGVAIGAGGGALLGAVIGKLSGSTGLGAAIGGAVGGVAGGIIGKKMDRQASEIKKQIPTAKVERVNENINIEFTSSVLFGFNQAAITDSAQKPLDDLVKILSTYPDTNIEIDGHTDNTGSVEYNQTLSEKRASVVANYLISKGIIMSRISTKGLSFSVPKYPNDTKEGRAQNRRVEFIITANDKMKTDAQKEAESTH